jgi:hypothetical protein
MQRKALKMTRNYRKDAGVDIEFTPTPIPTPPPDPTRRRRTPTPTPIRTPWPPKMYGTPTPEYLEYSGYPMAIREMGGGGIASKRMSKGGSGIYSVPEKDNSRGYRSSRTNQNSMPAYNPNRPNYTPGTINPNKPYYTPNPNYNPMRMSSGSRGAMKSMSKASKTQTSPYNDSPMYNNAKGTSRGPSRSDAYISYTTDPGGERLNPEQRGRMLANSAKGNISFIRDILSSTKVQDKVKSSLINALAYTPFGAVLGGGMKGAEFVQKIPSTKTYQSAAENAKGGIRGIQMLPKAVREANQSVLDELKGRSYGDYAIDTIAGKTSSIGDSVRSSGRKTIDSTRDALAQGYKQRESEARNSRGIGEIIGAAEALGFGDKQRKELLDMGGRTAGKAGRVATIAAQYHPAVMMANYLMSKIPSDVKSRGVVGNVKSTKNKISDFIVNNSRRALSSASAAGSKALSDAGNSISNWFDKSATSSRGSRSMSKSLKSNKRSNKYF